MRPEPDSRPAVCFAPGTSPTYVERVYRQLQVGEAPAVSLFQFNLGNRWSSTATNGGGLGQGFPTTLTWSVVPDGTFIPSAFNGDPAGNSNLRARLNLIYGSQAVWQPIIQQALDEWASRTGTNYVFENDDGAALPSPSSLGSPGVLGVRGDVRIAGRTIDGNSGILAYNWFPNAGDMVIDTADNFYNDTSSGSLRLRNVVSHEHGHGLGIDHVCPVNETKLMEPFFSDSFVGPQHDDTLAGQRGYGDNRENNDAAAQGTSFGAVGNGTFAANGGGLDDNSDLDFYRFTVTAGKQVDVTVTPVGATYVQGPQNTNGTLHAGHQLQLARAERRGAPGPRDQRHDGAGLRQREPRRRDRDAEQRRPHHRRAVLHPRVRGGSDTVQLYNLSFTVEDQAVADLAITKTDGQATAIPGQPVTYTIVATNTSATFTVNSATVADTFPAALTGVDLDVRGLGGLQLHRGLRRRQHQPDRQPRTRRNRDLHGDGHAPAGRPGHARQHGDGHATGRSRDPAAANNTATDTDTLTPQADLGITKTDGQTTEIPGTSLTYTIVVSNPGPSTVTGATVTDAFPAAFTGVTWTCAPASGSACAPAGGVGAHLRPGDPAARRHRRPSPRRARSAPRRPARSPTRRPSARPPA